MCFSTNPFQKIPAQNEFSVCAFIVGWLVWIKEVEVSMVPSCLGTVSTERARSSRRRCQPFLDAEVGIVEACSFDLIWPSAARSFSHSFFSSFSQHHLFSRPNTSPNPHPSHEHLFHHQQPNSNRTATPTQTMSSSTFSVKAQLADDIRRVRIPTDIAGAASSLGATFATDAALIQIYWTGE